MSLGIGIELLPSNIQKWTDLQQIITESRHLLHADNALQRCASKQIPENGLGVVVGMMGEENESGSRLPSYGLKENIPTLAGRCLCGKLRRCRKRRDVLAADHAGQIVTVGQPAHEGRILPRLPAAQTMIEMRNSEVSPALSDKEVQQSDRIPTARDADHCWLI